MSKLYHSNTSGIVMDWILFLAWIIPAFSSNKWKAYLIGLLGSKLSNLTDFPVTKVKKISKVTTLTNTFMNYNYQEYYFFMMIKNPKANPLFLLSLPRIFEECCHMLHIHLVGIESHTSIIKFLLVSREGPFVQVCFSCVMSVVFVEGDKSDGECWGKAKPCMEVLDSCGIESVF